MTNLSIVTPTHRPTWLAACYQSIKEQDFSEWLIVADEGIDAASLNGPYRRDRRVRIIPMENSRHYVGQLKRFGFSNAFAAGADICVELDHDDLLTPDAVGEIRQAFADPAVGFVYSNSANFQKDFEKTQRYDAAYGWRWRPYTARGKVLDEHLAFPEYPSGLCKIWYGPNHVRAWRRSAYEAAGGHPEDMRVLDDQDLISRTYLVTKFRHIDKCLYLYRVTGDNTWLQYNAEIQANAMRLNDLYLERVALRWAENNGLLALDMGAAVNPRAGFIPCDIEFPDYQPHPGNSEEYGGCKGCQSDYWHDEKNELHSNCQYCAMPMTERYDPSGKYPLSDWKYPKKLQFDACERWPFPDNSVGVVRCADFLEHIPDKVHLINEIYRVLAHGGLLLSETPSVSGAGGWRDPTHVTGYCDQSFWYYVDQAFQRFCPQIRARFMIDTLFEFHRDLTPPPGPVRNLLERPGEPCTVRIPYVRANLVAIKGDDLPGIYGWSRGSFE